MTKIKTLLVFFALVFGFRAFSSSVCSPEECEEFKSTALGYVSIIDDSLVDIYDTASYIDTNASGGSNPSAIVQNVQAIHDTVLSASSVGNQLYHFIDRVDCGSCTNGTCSFDLFPVVSVLSNIVSILELEKSSISFISTNIDYLVNGGLDSILTNQLAILDLLNANHTNLIHNLDNSLSLIISTLTSLNNKVSAININVNVIHNYVVQYLPYLETINSSLAYLATNNVVSLDSSVLSNFFSVVKTDWQELNQYGIPINYYLKTIKGSSTQNYMPNFPYNYTSLYDFNVGTLLAGGFNDLIRATHSLNNYWYWFMQKVLTNELNTAGITQGLSSLSNIASRIDSYVVGDFSNKFNEVVSLMNVIVTNQLYQLTNSNISALSALVETNNIYTVSNNIYLSSIDSKLDVLDYIKILSDTPLADYSGDVDYYDYLTNLYINGSADSGGVSTNWFERMEILLASLVFGDSDGTNDIPQSVEMEGVDSSAVQSALTDFTYNQEFTGAINALDDTRQSFIGVLNGLHTSIKSVSLPASISIGLGGLDGEDTHDFNDMMHGHFQVSFNTGIADRFTIAVRAVTTISWVLLFFLALWKSGFYLIRKLVYFYRLVTRLLVSVFTR